ncbi:MAG: REP-associated tyrosine transposase, partial [bacterium]
AGVVPHDTPATSHARRSGFAALRFRQALSPQNHAASVMFSPRRATGITVGRMESMPRKRMRRRGARGETRFVTCSCLDGRRLLQARTAQQTVVQELDALVRSDAASLHAWVIMGNHLHLLLTPRLVDLEESLAVLKTRIAYAITDDAETPQQVWERGGGFDRLIWSDRAYWNILFYIHFNPVKAGLASAPEDWQWSSARDWTRQRRNTPKVSHPYWLE